MEPIAHPGIVEALAIFEVMDLVLGILWLGSSNRC